MSAQGNSHSRNPNICASCSSLVDGETPANVIQLPEIEFPEPGAEELSVEQAQAVSWAI